MNVRVKGLGKDRLTVEMSPMIPGQVKLKKYEHLESHKLPPHWQNIIKENDYDVGRL